MADVVGARVKCPECGANSDAIGDVLKCSYCGTSSRVQRRTQFGMKVPLPPPLPQAPRRVAVEVSNNGVKMVAVAAGAIGLLAAVMGVGIALSTHRIESRAKAIAAKPPVPPPHRLDWNTGRPLVADNDDDGIGDVIGIQRDVTADQMFLVGLSGATGNVMWRTPSLGTYNDVYRKQLVLSSGVVLVGDRDRDQALAAFEASTGKPLFTAKLTEVVDRICTATAPRTVRVITKDQVSSLVDLSSGQVTPYKPKARERCTELVESNVRQGEHLDFTMRHSRKLPGMTNDTIYGHEAPWIITGTKDPGSRLPMIAALDDNDKVLWTSVVPLRDPMSVKFEEPAATDVEGDTVATAYIRSDKEAPVLTVFDRKTGARKFERPLAYRATMFVQVNSVVLAKKIIYVTMNESIQAFDRETGAPKWVLGDTR